MQISTGGSRTQKRTFQACTECKVRKTRCSGRFPACASCNKHDRVCRYRRDREIPGPSRRSLPLKTAQLESMDVLVDTLLICTPDARIHRKPEHELRMQGNMAEKDLERDSDFLRAQKQRNTLTSTLTGILRSEDVQEMPWEPELADMDTITALQDGLDQLPSTDLQHELIMAFFCLLENNFPPLFRKDSFLHGFKARQIAPMILLSICALSKSCTEHREICNPFDRHAPDRWANTARNIALARYDRPEVAVLQTYVLLSLYDYSIGDINRAYMLSGMATRMSYTLKLCPTMHSSSLSNHLGHDLGCGLWFTCRYMDFFFSFLASRPLPGTLSLPRHGSVLCAENCSIPSSVSDKPRSIDINLCIADILDIWATITSSFDHGHSVQGFQVSVRPDSPFHRAQRAAAQWSMGLQPSAQYSAKNVSIHTEQGTIRSFLIMHGLHLTVQLCLYRIEALQRENLKADSERHCRKSCESAADHVAEFIHEHSYHLWNSPLMGYAAFYASQTHIHATFSTDKLRADKSCEMLSRMMAFLDKMRIRWRSLCTYAHHLRCHYIYLRSRNQMTGSDKNDSSSRYCCLLPALLPIDYRPGRCNNSIFHQHISPCLDFAEIN